MKRAVLMLGLTLAVGIAVGVIGSRGLTAQQDTIKRTALLKTDLEGIQGKEGIVLMVELAPGAATGKHYHPGHEFAYVMEGSALVETEGKPPATMKRGSVAHLAPNEVHNVKNPSKSEPMKALVFAIYEKGQPSTVSVK